MGLKEFRSGKGKKPSYHCDNCKCDRYGPCKCQRKKKQKTQKKKKDDKIVVAVCV